MWEHRRLVVVHAFITEVIIDYLDELYKFLSSTKHAFCHLEREREGERVKPLLKMCKLIKSKIRMSMNTTLQRRSHLFLVHISPFNYLMFLLK